jgi:two-component system sensor histidine kinase ChiS
MTDKFKVLIIEDNPVNAQLLKLYLESAGFEVLHAASGHAGLDMAATKYGINAILLDRIMPDMDGLHVLKALKQAETSWQVPVIMTTAALSTAQIEEAKMFGAYACLPKPYNKDKIIATINEALAQGG